MSSNEYSLKEKLKTLLSLKIPENMSLIPLTRTQIKMILRAHSGKNIKIGNTLSFNLESEAELVNVVSLFGLPRFARVSVCGVSDFDQYSAQLGRLLSVAHNEGKEIGLCITGESNHLGILPGIARISGVRFSSDEAVYHVFSML
jgi:hypothetical protein